MSVISIILCTRDRARDLSKTLESIAQVQMPVRHSVELLVVDNGSRDQTAEVVKQWHSPVGMEVHYVYVGTPGKGYAYNAGIREAKGDILLFTDDDVRFPDHWIEGMVAPIENGQADAVAGGVRIAPHLMRPWLTQYMRECYASTEGINPLQPERMVGANMGFHRRILAVIPGFDENIGPGSKYGLHDETLFSWQLVEHGFRLVSAFHVEVEHHFTPDRLCSCSMMKNAYRLGVSDGYVTWHWNQIGPDRYRHDLAVILWRALPRLPRLLWLAISKKEYPIQEEELKFVRKLFFLLQYNLETHGPPCYPFKGSVKISLQSNRTRNSNK